ncbi:hypothetical protein [Nocardia sp. IFM 10818]
MTSTSITDHEVSLGAFALGTDALYRLLSSASLFVRPATGEHLASECVQLRLLGDRYLTATASDGRMLAVVRVPIHDVLAPLSSTGVLLSPTSVTRLQTAIAPAGRRSGSRRAHLTIQHRTLGAAGTDHPSGATVSPETVVPWLVVRQPGREEFATPVAAADPLPEHWGRLLFDHARYPQGVWASVRAAQDRNAALPPFDAAPASLRLDDLARIVVAAWNPRDAVMIEPAAQPNAATVVRVGENLIAVLPFVPDARPDHPAVRASWSEFLDSADPSQL